MKKCCKTCNYCFAVKKRPVYQEVLTLICTFFLLQENSGCIMEVDDDDVCECYVEYKE